MFERSVSENRKEAVKRINEKVDIVIRILDRKFIYIFDWYNTVSEYENINLKELNYIQAENMSDKWHKELKASGEISKEKNKIILELDNNFYWVDLESTSCKEEANAMGHCASTSYGDTLLSLRSKKPNGVIEPHVTLSYDTDQKLIVQMKGKKNQKPSQKYHKYIVDLLIVNSGDYVIEGTTSEYMDVNDFMISDLSLDLFKRFVQNKNNIKSFLSNITNQVDQAKLFLTPDKANIIKSIIGEKDFNTHYNDLTEISKDIKLKNINNDLYLIFNDYSDLVYKFITDKDSDIYAKRILEYDAYHLGDYNFEDAYYYLDYVNDNVSKYIIEKIEEKQKIELPKYDNYKNFEKYYNEVIKDSDYEYDIEEKIIRAYGSAMVDSYNSLAYEKLIDLLLDFIKSIDNKVINYEHKLATKVSLDIFNVIHSEDEDENSLKIPNNFLQYEYPDFNTDFFNEMLHDEFNNYMYESKKYIITKQQKQKILESIQFLNIDDYKRGADKKDYLNMLSIILNLKTKRYYSKEEAEDIYTSYQYLSFAKQIDIIGYLREMGYSIDTYNKKLKIANNIIDKMISS